MTFKWDPDKNIPKLKTGLNRRIAMVAISWVNHAKRKLNEKLNRSGKTPSAQGEYPAMVTSNLRGKVEYELIPHKMEARVGTNVLYGKFLELGFRKGGKLVKRPWMKLTNQGMIGTARQILGRKFKFGGGK